MLELLLRRSQPEAMAGNVDVVTAMVHRMSDGAVAQFVSNSVIAERGPTDRLAQAFHALVPDTDRQRQLLALAETEVGVVGDGPGSRLPGLVAEGRVDAHVVLGREIRLRRVRARS